MIGPFLYNVMLHMFYVYSIQSQTNPDSYYVGITTQIQQRLQKHNSDITHHTYKYAPWSLAFYIALPDKTTALAFEKYLKSGSGRAFTKKHFSGPPS